MITVVIASYGYGHLAAHCIESILSQTVLPARTLFVDDGAHDCLHLEGLYPEIEFIHRQKNLGTVANFQDMLLRVETEYVMFIGADNWVRSDTIELLSKEKADILKAVGAEVIVCPTNVAPEDPNSYYSVAKRLAKEVPHSFHCNQYDNLANRLAHYESTGPEIWEQTEGKITHFVCTAGTGGTITGTAQYLKEKNPNIKIWAIDVYGSLLTNYFKTGKIDMGFVHPYISEGFGEDFVPLNYDMSVIDHFEQVTDRDGAIMARRIAKEEGMFCGYSAGSCLQGLMQLKDSLQKDDLVVCVFHDHGSRYVGKIYNDQWMMERGFLDVKTFKDLVAGRGTQKLITLNSNQTVEEAIALMKKYDIENIPVFNVNENIGAISEGGLFDKILNDASIKQQAIESIMEKPYPEVAFETPVERLSQFITKENGAVLSKDESGNYHIVTKYDIIQGLVK